MRIFPLFSFSHGPLLGGLCKPHVDLALNNFSGHKSLRRSQRRLNYIILIFNNTKRELYISWNFKMTWCKCVLNMATTVLTYARNSSVAFEDLDNWTFSSASRFYWREGWKKSMLAPQPATLVIYLEPYIHHLIYRIFHIVCRDEVTEYKDCSITVTKHNQSISGGLVFRQTICKYYH